MRHWLRGEQVGLKSLNRFVDLDEAKANGVEDEPIGEIAALEMTSNCLYGIQDVGEPIFVVTTHSGTAS